MGVPGNHCNIHVKEGPSGCLSGYGKEVYRNCD